MDNHIETTDIVTKEEKDWYNKVICFSCEHIWMHAHRDTAEPAPFSQIILRAQVGIAFTQVTTLNAPLTDGLGLIRNIVRSVITNIAPMISCSDEEEDHNMPMVDAAYVDQRIKYCKHAFMTLIAPGAQRIEDGLTIAERIDLGAHAIHAVTILATQQPLSSAMLLPPSIQQAETSRQNIPQASTHAFQQGEPPDTSSDPTP